MSAFHLQGNDIPFPGLPRPLEEYLDTVRDMTPAQVRDIFRASPEQVTPLKYAVIYLASMQLHTKSIREPQPDYLELTPWNSIREVPARLFPGGEIIFQVDPLREHPYRHPYSDGQYHPTQCRMVLNSEESPVFDLGNGYQTHLGEWRLDGAPQNFPTAVGPFVVWSYIPPFQVDLGHRLKIQYSRNEEGSVKLHALVLPFALFSLLLQGEHDHD
jgi:hypothetical protein